MAIIVGLFIQEKKYMSGKLLVKQVNKFKTDRLTVARAIVKGIGINIYEVLYHYYKHDKKEVKEVLDWIKTQFYSAVNEVKSIPELMAFEGDLWLRFYSTFKYFLPEDFIMNKTK